MAAQPVPDPLIGNPFSGDDSRSTVWPQFFAAQRRWFDLCIAAWKQLASVMGPSDYWDWLLKHIEIFPVPIDGYRDPLTHRPGWPNSRPPTTYNPDWVSEQPDLSKDVDYIQRLHSRMLDESIAAFVIKQSDRDLAAKLVEFWAQHLSQIIGNASQVLEDHVSAWRTKWLMTISEHLKRRWPVTTWESNNASPEFWRKIRADFEALDEGDYRLIWTTVPPRALTGELLESHYHWWRSPSEGARGRLSAIAKRAAIALGYKSDDGWYDELRNADFVKFQLTGSGHQKDEHGSMVPIRDGPIKDVLAHSITLTFLLEADSEAKSLASIGRDSSEEVAHEVLQDHPLPGTVEAITAAATKQQRAYSVRNILSLKQLEAYRRGLDNLDGLLAGIEADGRLSPPLQKQINLLFSEMAGAGILTAECEIDELPHWVRFQIHAVRPTIEAMIETHSNQLGENPPGIANASKPARARRMDKAAERAARRQAVIMPILDRKGWTQGRLASEAGLGKNSVYKYLDGTRSTITGDNRKAIAEALGLEPGQLPD